MSGHAPTPGPSSAGGAARPPSSRRRGLFRVGAVIAVACGIIGIVIVGWYANEIRGLIALHVWSKRGPTEMVQAYARALRSSDVAGLEAMVPGSAIDTKDSAIVRFRPPGPPGRASEGPGEVATYVPKVPLEDATFDYEPTRGALYIALRSEAGTRLQIVLRPKGKGWEIAGLYPIGGPTSGN